MKLIAKNNYDANYGDVYKQYYDEIHARRELTPLDKIIYMFIRNKFNLSLNNGDKYINENGEYFVYYNQKELAEDVFCSERAVRNAFKRFQAIDKDGNPIEGLTPLIKLDNSETNTYKIFFYELTGECGKYERKNGAVEAKKAKPAKTTPKPVELPVEPTTPVPAPVDNSVDIVGTSCVKPVDNMGAVTVEPTPFDFYLAQAEREIEREQEMFSYANEKFSEVEESFAERNKESLERLNKKKKIKKSNNKSIYLSSNTPKVNKIDDEIKYRQIIANFKDQIDYGYLVENINDKHILDEFVFSAIDMLMSDRTRISGTDKPLAVIQSVLSRLTHFHIEKVIQEFCKLTTKIDNISGYMKSMLYNIAMNFNAQVSNEFRYTTSGVA